MRKLFSGMALAFTLTALHSQTLDLAQAREMDLDGLTGLGPSTTRKILTERERAPFSSWQDLLQRVPGIGQKKAQALSRQGLRVQGKPYPSLPDTTP